MDAPLLLSATSRLTTGGGGEFPWLSLHPPCCPAAGALLLPLCRVMARTLAAHARVALGGAAGRFLLCALGFSAKRFSMAAAAPLQLVYGGCPWVPFPWGLEWSVGALMASRAADGVQWPVTLLAGGASWN